MLVLHVSVKNSAFINEKLKFAEVPRKGWVSSAFSKPVIVTQQPQRKGILHTYCHTHTPQVG